MSVTRDKQGKVIGATVEASVYSQGDGASEQRAKELNAFSQKALKTEKSNFIGVGFKLNPVL